MYSSALSSQIPGIHWSFYCLYGFTISRRAYSWNFFLFSWKERFKAFMSVRSLMAYPGMDQIDSRWQTHLLNIVAFLQILSPVPLVLPSSHVEVQGDMCWILIHRRPQIFCLLLQWTQIPVGCVVNKGAISLGPLLWAHPRLLNDGHSDQSEVVPHYSFDLHLSN